MATKNPLDPSLTNPFLPAYSATPGRSYDAATGGVPAAANPLYTAQKAITGDVGLLPDLKGLGRGVNAQLFGQYTGRLPGYSEMAQTSSGNIQSLLKGEIPQDVLYQIGQRAAERGVGAGVSGSPFENSEYLRALGLTSLGLQQQGEQEFTGAMGRVGQIPFFDVSRFLVTPEMEQTAAEKANVLATAPVPSAAAAAEKRNLIEGLGAGYGGGGPAGGQGVWPGEGYDPYADPSSPFYHAASQVQF